MHPDHPDGPLTPLITEAYEPQWNQAYRLVALVFLIVVGLYTVTLLGAVTQMLTLTFLFAMLLHGPVNTLHKQASVPYPAAVALVYVGVLVLGILAMGTVVPTIIDSANNLFVGLNESLQQLDSSLQAYEPGDVVVSLMGLQVDFDSVITPLRDLLYGVADEVTGTTSATEIDLQAVVAQLASAAGVVTSTITAAFSSVAGFISSIFLALFISLLVLLDWPRTLDALDRAVPDDFDREYDLLLEKTGHVWRGFFRGQVAVGGIIGLLTYVQLAVLGIPGAAALAVFTGFISLIPTLGGFIALIPLAIVPLLQGSNVYDIAPLPLMLLVVISNLIITQVIWNVLAPSILGNVLDLPMPVIIIGIFVGAALGGILGAFLIAPILSMLRIYVFYLLAKIAGVDPFPGEEPGRRPRRRWLPSVPLPQRKTGEIKSVNQE